MSRVKLNARLHQLLALNKFDANDKRALCREVSGGLKASAKDLTEAELQAAIGVLEGRRMASIKRMQAKAINKAKELGILPGTIRHKTDWQGLNTFCQHTFRKDFPALTYEELRHCITGLERWQDGRLSKQIRDMTSDTSASRFHLN